MSEIVSFYSYKGGVGRSMAVANVAWLLARLGHRTLVVDFDLEAPGLHRYFRESKRGASEGEEWLGVIDLFVELRARLSDAMEPIDELITDLLDSGRFGSLIDVALPDTGRHATLSFLRAGRFDAQYAERVREFPWFEFYQEWPEAFAAIIAALKRRYDYILLDSRTGISDVGSVSTVVLADKLVLVFAPNQQSLHGAVEFGRQAMALKHGMDPGARLALFPLLSRVEEGEEDERRRWIADSGARFAALFAEVEDAQELDLDKYFAAVHIPHRSHYAYGERIAIEEEPAGALGSLAEGYARFLDCLLGPQLLGWQERVRNVVRLRNAPVLWLTYAHADNKDKDVDFIAQELKNAGLTVHLDRWAISAGKRLWEQIDAGIRSSDAWMIYATANSTESEPCREELAYALDRALNTRGAAFPVIALFPGEVDTRILPPALKVRLCISSADADWKERILSATEGRRPRIDANTLEPFVFKVHRLPGSPSSFAIEMRPRAGVWSSFVVALPTDEVSRVGVRLLVMGGKDAPNPNAGSALFDYSEGADGQWSWKRVGSPQPSPTLSAYLHCRELPSRLLFGTIRGPQYVARDLAGEPRIVRVSASP